MKASNVFLSWSGERSLYVAKFFHDWLPKVLQRAKPWLSDADIEKGTIGLDEIKKALAGKQVGIFFLTPENRESLWVPYEAGALANALDDRTRICTYLLADLQIQHVNGPLGVFQHTKSERDDTLKLIRAINRAIGEEVVPESTLEEIFDKWWPDLEGHLKQMPKPEGIPKPLPSPDQMIAEILELSRAAANSRKEAEWLEPFAADFKNVMPILIQGLKGLTPDQLRPAPPAPAPPREPTSTFCIKLAGDSDIKRIDGTVAAMGATGQVVVLVGSEVVAKFESVEAWWREIPAKEIQAGNANP
jgi:hypothetical protein